MAVNDITDYVNKLDRIYRPGNATEHSYRHALQELLENIVKAEDPTLSSVLQITNEPKRTICGTPDYIITKNEIPVGYIEAKDAGMDLTAKMHKEQFVRYKESLENIIFTNYLDFHFYRNGEPVENIRIGEIKGDKIVPIKENFGRFSLLVMQFCRAQAQSITSSNILASIMAAKARLLAGVIENVLLPDSKDGGALAEQMTAFKDTLISGISPKEFAGLYAQTIAYGMFAARLHNTKIGEFDRKDVAGLIPKTSPFLRRLFDNIAGIDIDDRIRWIVDDLAETFKVTDIQTIMADFGKDTQQDDPIIHFYEDFLSAYDPTLRKSRGVWYTPQPVVNFIVRAVDDILQKEFDPPLSLADTSKTKIKILEDQTDKDGNKKTVERIEEVHKVQILDPATGTGTFLAETISQIYNKFKKQKGSWQDYVKQHLIPRLNGFEILMASYAMAHIKLNWLLTTQTDYKLMEGQRLHVYLTNSLEEHHKSIGTPFAQFLALEANEASKIKKDTPVMVVIGNPPYSGESQNRNDWIDSLMKDYKKEPDTELPLQERNSKAINDDYCKFIRLGQHFIDKNEEGVLAYITNHSFLDNPTFRGMRWNLLKCFDTIYIIDLHGNSKKKEVCPDGSKDENVFDIQQGVSINIFVKTGRKSKNALAKVYHFDVFGKRHEKYDYLLKHKLSKVPFTKLQPSAPEYFFVPKDYGNKEEYENGFGIQELFPVNSVGVVTAKDMVFVNDDRKKLLNNIKEYVNVIPDEKLIQKISYRPFDNKYVYYDAAILDRARTNVMRHFLKGENVGLATIRINKEKHFSGVFVTKNIADSRLSDRFMTNVFPLYTYQGNSLFNGNGAQTERDPNLDDSIVNEISQRIGLRFTAEQEKSSKTFAPIDILDYIYAVLHSPTYREKYKEFLKINFPRVPYPEDAKQFRRLAKLGERLRRLHLLEDVKLKDGFADFGIPGSNEIDRPYYCDGRVYINSAQYFDHVPQEAWEFYIGGYQPAQKWLKDRKGQKLGYDDIEHYRRVVTALRETGRVMEEVDVF